MLRDELYDYFRLPRFVGCEQLELVQRNIQDFEDRESEVPAVLPVSELVGTTGKDELLVGAVETQHLASLLQLVRKRTVDNPDPVRRCDLLSILFESGLLKKAYQVRPGSTLKKAYLAIQSSSASSEDPLMVVEDGQLVGILLQSDLLRQIS